MQCLSNYSEIVSYRGIGWLWRDGCCQFSFWWCNSKKRMELCLMRTAYIKTTLACVILKYVSRSYCLQQWKRLVLNAMAVVRLCDWLLRFQINIKYGRALKPGEHRVQLYQLILNDPEVNFSTQYLIMSHSKTNNELQTACYWLEYYYIIVVVIECRSYCHFCQNCHINCTRVSAAILLLYGYTEWQCGILHIMALSASAKLFSVGSG